MGGMIQIPAVSICPVKVGRPRNKQHVGAKPELNEMANWMWEMDLLFKLLQLQEHEIIYTSFSANRPYRLLVRALD